MRFNLISIICVVLLCLPAGSCTSTDRNKREPGVRTIVFRHGKIENNAGQFDAILRRFEREHPGIAVKDEVMPSSTDEQHQFYVINLEGKSADFDVFSMDVIWVPEFARAGWLRDVSGLVSVQDREEDFFPGPLDAVTVNGSLYAIPWYIDAGMLYYRTDLLKKYGFGPPRTWYDLVWIARAITEREPGLYGFVWQGKQYEGLVCNTLEFLWSNGGEVLQHGEPEIDSAENRAAIGFMHDLVAKYKVSPPLVTTAVEETSRHIFGNGRAVFMRNWPYAWTVFQKPGSVVRGKVGAAMLPSFPGHDPAATLGGWQLGINRFSRNPDAAAELIRFLASPRIEKELALAIGYNPARRSLYSDPDMIRANELVPVLRNIFENARPRPVTPYYMMITQVLQPEFSAAVTGIRTPDKALTSAQKQIGHILEAGP